MRSEDFTRDFSDEDEFEVDDSSPSRHRHSTVFIGGVDGNEALVGVIGDDGLLLLLLRK